MKDQAFERAKHEVSINLDLNNHKDTSAPLVNLLSQPNKNRFEKTSHFSSQSEERSKLAPDESSFGSSA